MTGILDVLRTVVSPDKLIQLLTPLFTSWVGYAMLFAVVFSETGLLVGFFLPGDSLLFLVGTVAGAGNLDMVAVNIVLMAAAGLGGTFGFARGGRPGPRVFKPPPSRPFSGGSRWRAALFFQKH